MANTESRLSKKRLLGALAGSGALAIVLGLGLGSSMRAAPFVLDPITCLPTCDVDGRSFVSAGDDRTLRLWSVERGDLLATFRGDAPYCCVSAARTGPLVVAGDTLGRLHILDAVI